MKNDLFQGVVVFAYVYLNMQTQCKSQCSNQTIGFLFEFYDSSASSCDACQAVFTPLIQNALKLHVN